MREHKPSKGWMTKAYLSFRHEQSGGCANYWDLMTVRSKLASMHKAGCHADDAGRLVAQQEMMQDTQDGLIARIGRQCKEIENLTTERDEARRWDVRELHTALLTTKHDRNTAEAEIIRLESLILTGKTPTERTKVPS